ncbi:MAG: DUF4115 domain-containing protein, partial [Pseudomonadota bacterium]|nr:DUF4115 domain-containing protein [Pseudomonadota bacterium]
PVAADSVPAGASAPAAAFPPGATLPQEAALPPGAASAAPETPAAPTPGHARLVMAFAKDCWVDVKDAAGNRLAYGIMKGDTVQNLSGRAPFSVVLGNATVVNLELNGRPVDKSVFVPRRGTVSKFVLDVPRQDG